MIFSFDHNLDVVKLNRLTFKANVIWLKSHCQYNTYDDFSSLTNERNMMQQTYDAGYLVCAEKLIMGQLYFHRVQM